MSLIKRVSRIGREVVRSLQMSTDMLEGEGLSSDGIERWIAAMRGSDDSTFARPLEERVVPLFRAIQMRAQAVSRARLRVTMPAPDGGLEPVDDSHPVQRLLDHVNNTWSRARMWQAVESDLCLWGQSFRQIVRNDSPDPSAWEIWPLPARYMEVRMDDRGAVEGYIRHQMGQRVPLARDEVIWDRYHNARDTRRGMSPLLVAAGPARLADAMMLFNRLFFERGATHSNIAFWLHEHTSPRQIDEFHERYQARYAGLGNAHKPIVGVGQGSVVNLGMSQAEMEFVAGLNLMREQIADVYGVPDELMAGANHPTFSNREAARRYFYSDTIVQDDGTVRVRAAAIVPEPRVDMGHVTHRGNAGIPDGTLGAGGGSDRGGPSDHQRGPKGLRTGAAAVGRRSAPCSRTYATRIRTIAVGGRITARPR